jgi:hypothetical protein
MLRIITHSVFTVFLTYLKNNSDFSAKSINEFTVIEAQCAVHEAETELLNTVHVIVMLRMFNL